MTDPTLSDALLSASRLDQIERESGIPELPAVNAEPLMIKGRAVMHLDGDFKKDHPVPSRSSYQVGATWYIMECGPI